MGPIEAAVWLLAFPLFLAVLIVPAALSIRRERAKERWWACAGENERMRYRWEYFVYGKGRGQPMPHDVRDWARKTGMDNGRAS